MDPDRSSSPGVEGGFPVGSRGAGRGKGVFARVRDPGPDRGKVRNPNLVGWEFREVLVEDVGGGVSPG